VTGGTKSRIWSIGSIPVTIMSAFVDTKDGMTRPGQSHSTNDSSRYSVYNKIQREIHDFRKNTTKLAKYTQEQK